MLTESQTSSLDESHIPLYHHDLNNKQHSRSNNKDICLLLLCVLCFLLNPLFGVVALMAALKSRRHKSCTNSAASSSSSSQQLASNAKRVSLAGIFISLVLIAAFVSAMYITNKSMLDLVATISSANVTKSHAQSKPPSHKLHFWPNEAKGMRQTRNNYTANSTAIAATAARTTTDRNKTQKPVRYYDRLSILIDHDLFKNLNFNYKIANESSLK